ncbi:O-Antigen ligase [Dethiosulfatibacter aminovorans DSM 17477]|uniref:O-Antigen ligase n=1 Tax=Dethiosulfatibacter aminovorans DSM 17477 TaxID=1121476 RepID=A0A1M6KPS2_9FIRM|nr:O-antigen ligase family protein [Dethiosulfatibacter aminovorans]SHJ60902.1 O-Antigen ligase [Dethiosulfatibacter aminovorans DSM 17477]
MTKKRNTKNNNKKNIDVKSVKKDLEWYYLIPLMLIVAVIPLIVFADNIKLDDVEKLYWKGGETNVDFFSYYKSIFFAATVFVSVILLVLLRLSGEFRFKKSKYYIPVGIYLLFVLVSYLMSDYDVVAKRGFVEQFQGVWVMVAYGLVILAALNLVQNESHVKIMTGSYILLGLAVGVIGLGQYLGLDFFKTDFGKYLILPENLHNIGETLNFKFKDREIYATMYNTNFVGSFADIMMCLSIALFVYVRGSKKTVWAAIFFVLMEIIWIGSNSRAGLVGFLLGAVFIAVFYRKRIKRLAMILVAGIIVMTGLNVYSHGDVFSEFLSMSLSRESERLDDKSEENVRIEDLKFEDNSLCIVTENETLMLTLGEEVLSFYDGDGEQLGVTEDNGVLSFVDEAYSEYEIKVDGEKGRLLVSFHDQEITLYITGKNGFKMRSSGGVIGTTEYPDRLEFMDGYERFATSRGYIWSRSIPMLKDTLLIGHGPDTYAMEFPQKDYVGKMNAYKNATIIVDKPHNMFIQIGVNTGVVSMLALVAVFFMYFMDSMKLYWRRDMSTFLDCLGVGCVTGMIAYLGAGMFNDQIISVAPVFYVLVGLGIAINDILKKKALEE